MYCCHKDLTGRGKPNKKKKGKNPPVEGLTYPERSFLCFSFLRFACLLVLSFFAPFQHRDRNGNELTGAIPPELGKLPHAQYMSVPFFFFSCAPFVFVDTLFADHLFPTQRLKCQFPQLSRLIVKSLSVFLFFLCISFVIVAVFLAQITFPREPF